ncbi:angio-associated migratory cell protein-like isoform X2 [Apostichopus japonicus]|uniref:angio-associated migratory cell protein-like isoform X2 n=1 Tax=Stichopus japonicus TaxID=307972 RepID=UPI003AB8634A
MDPEDDVNLNEDDFEEVTDEDLQPNGGGGGDDIEYEMGDMDLEQYDDYEEGEEEYNEEMQPDEEAGAAPTSDDADVCFKKHSGSVFACALEPTTGSLAISGGEDDKAYVWNTSDGAVILECSGHKDSVTCVGFNREGTLAASGDMSGIIKVWKVESKEELWSFEGSDLEWLRWHPVANVLLGGTSEGDVWMWKVPSGDTKMMQGHGCLTSCGRVLPDGKRCIVGYEDGASKIWDLKDQALLHHIKAGGHGHSDSITCMDCHKDNVMALTGSVDGTAKLLNTNTGKVVATFPAGAIDESIGDTNSVESLEFSSSQSLVAIGSLNGLLSIWDVPTQKLRHQCRTETGVVKVKWDPTSPVVIAAGLDGRIQLWDARSGQRSSSYEGHSKEILDFDLSSDGNTILTSSGDDTCRIFKISQPER